MGNAEYMGAQSLTEHDDQRAPAEQRQTHAYN